MSDECVCFWQAEDGFIENEFRCERVAEVLTSSGLELWMQVTSVGLKDNDKFQLVADNYSLLINTRTDNVSVLL